MTKQIRQGLTAVAVALVIATTFTWCTRAHAQDQVCITVEDILTLGAPLQYKQLAFLKGDDWNRFLEAQMDDGTKVPDLVIEAETALVMSDGEQAFIFSFKTGCDTGLHGRVTDQGAKRLLKTALGEPI